MPQKPLISIIIPTYNRVGSLEALLRKIMPQAKAMEGLVQVCISDNCSTDTTKSLVLDFQKQYPGLILYHRQESNLGVALNLLTVMGMAEGDFSWIIGDDDLVVDGGLKKVADFIKGSGSTDTGLVALGHRSYYVEHETGKEVVYFQTVDRDKPSTYAISREDIISMNFPNSAFFSVLIYNNQILQAILRDEKSLIQEAVKARDYIHTFLYQLMFLRYPQLTALRLNEAIIDEELHYYKYYIEDRFRLHYVAKKKMDAFLSANSAPEYKKITAGWDKSLVKGIILEMAQMRCFRVYHYDSFFGCISMFFKEAPLKEALHLSFFFIFFSIMPSFLIKGLLKAFVRFRHKAKWQEVWFSMTVMYDKMAQGSRRQLS